MWLLNGGRTDHLLGHLWVLHQDHYLTGEWAKNFGTIVHNDLWTKVLHQKDVEANSDSWGLQDVQLPMFSLSETAATEDAGVRQSAGPTNGDLTLSREVDWSMEPVHRLSHYHPEVLTLYLQESLRVARPDSLVAYLGQSPITLDLVRIMWANLSHSE